jgi:hypothetical protein
MFAYADSTTSACKSRALVAVISIRQRSWPAELAGHTGGAEEGHFIPAIVIEVDKMALPAGSGPNGAAVTIATDEVRGNHTEQNRGQCRAATSASPRPVHDRPKDERSRI